MLSLENLLVLESFLEKREVLEGLGVINVVALSRVSYVILVGVEVEARGVVEVFIVYIAF